MKKIISQDQGSSEKLSSYPLPQKEVTFARKLFCVLMVIHSVVALNSPNRSSPLSNQISVEG